MTWTFRCLNTKRCGGVFTADSPEAKCPKCKTRRLRWLPQHFGIRTASPGIDRELRTLADNFGMSDMHSARAGEAVRKPHQPTAAKTTAYTPAPGWGIQLNTNSDGTPVATCAPAPMSAKVSVKPGARAGKSNLGGPVPVIEASHKAKV